MFSPIVVVTVVSMGLTITVTDHKKYATEVECQQRIVQIRQGAQMLLGQVQDATIAKAECKK